jgi:L-alanine-DL-glutamate epimerase-like enolase superfamily enzyme
MPEILELRAEHAPVQMKSAFESAKRRSTVAENVRVTVMLPGGVTGYGEASPAEYVTGETPDSVLTSVGIAAEALLRSDAARVERWSAALREALPHSPTACSAVEMAILDALTQSWRIPLATYFGGAVREVRSDLTVTIGGVDECRAIAVEAAGNGFRSLKIKVGCPDRELDFARVLAVSQAAPGAGIRLDANQAFDPEEAVAFVKRCQAAGVPVEIMEQPVPASDWDGLAAVTRSSPVPVIADEAVVDARAALRVASSGAAHGVNIKVAKAGLLGALQIIAIARAGGLKLMLGCMMESLLGIGASLHLACGTGAFDYLDLDAHTLIGLKAESRPFSQAGDVLRVNEELTGIGWTP